MSKEPYKELGLAKCIEKMYKKPGYKHPLGKLGHYIGIFILLSFVIIIIPMFLITWFLSPLYFWFYRQEPVSPKAFFHFDRHKVKDLSFWDKLAYEYCELANGTLQWMLAIVNEIERRWCPVKNHCDAHCPKVKEWRNDYLEYDHDAKERLEYYAKQFPDNFPLNK